MRFRKGQVMAIKIIRQDEPQPPQPLKASELIEGELYIWAENSYGTLYTKAHNGEIIWMANGEIGICPYKYTEGDRYIPAPLGTQVVIG
jgi:hypothetical protein